MRRYLLIISILGIVLGADYARCQYLKDIDRKEIGELRRITPPPGAVELKLTRSFPTKAQEDSGSYLLSPTSCARDRRGNFYITDAEANVIRKFDPSGRYAGEYGRSGQGPGDFLFPARIAIFDDVLHVHDVGNRRVEYLDIEGRYLESIRMLKDYTDLIFLPDGRLVGAPLLIAGYKKDLLIEVMDSVGKSINAFGFPFEFKYDSSAMNSRKILINSKNEIILVFEFLPILRKYSLQGRLLQENLVETQFSHQKERINRRMNSYLPGQKAAKIVLFAAAGILNDMIFLVDYVPPRMWIWAVDKDFRIVGIYYWVNTEDFLNARYILPFIENGQTNFAILGSLSQGGEERIHFYAPIKGLGMTGLGTPATDSAGASYYHRGIWEYPVARAS